MSIQITPINKDEMSSSNILFVCMSFESTRWKEYLSSTNYDKVVIFYNKEFIHLYSENISLFKIKPNYELIETSIDNPLLTTDNYIDLVSKYYADKIDIDCSTFTHEHLLILLKVFKHLEFHTKINIIYTSVKKYLIAGDNGWLSKGTKDIRNVVGYSGNLLPSKPLHIIVLVGLENERIQKIIEEYEPNKISIGKGSNNSSLNEGVSELNIKLHKKVDDFTKDIISNLNESQEFEFSCDNPEETFEILNTIINKNKEFNNVIIAANSKISTIGVAKIGLLNEDVQICYAQPIEYNTSSYTDGIKEFKYFELKFK